MKKHVGIILKKYSPQKQKLSIFDASLGRIEALYNNDKIIQTIHHGSVVQYHREQRHSNLYLITQCEQQTVPFELAHYDINFLHHILELSYYFLPLNSPYPETFELLKIALNNAILNKAILLMRFFSSLGIYSEDLPLEKNYFHRLLSDHFETILKEKFNETQLKQIDLWLMRCKELHPYSKNFKTNYLLTRCNNEKKY